MYKYLCFNVYAYMCFVLFADLYPSSYEEWQPVQSIAGVINCIHSFIGEQQYEGRKHGDLAKVGIFFYDHFYNVSPSLENCTLHKLPLPSFLSTEWHLPCSNVSESFRCKLLHEVQKALKPNNPTRYVKVKVNMPIEVFVDFFAYCPISTKNTMLVCRNMDQETILQFMDEGWNRKCCNNILCEIDLGSVSAKYMIKSQNFIVSFFYRRFHFVHGTKVSLDIGEEQDGKIVDIEIFLNNAIQTIISLGKYCTLSQLRADLVNEDEIDLPESFLFKVNNAKVNILNT